MHWAASSNQHAVALMLANQKGFDPDAEVSRTSSGPRALLSAFSDTYLSRLLLYRMTAAGLL